MPYNDRTCTICLGLMSKPIEPRSDAYKFRCFRCGNYILTESADAILLGRTADDPKIPILGHFVRRMQLAEDCPTLDSDVINRILETGELPSLGEQADNLLRYVAGRVVGPGESLEFTWEEVQFIVGAKTQNGVRFFFSALERELLDGSSDSDGACATPTFAGWQRYDELRRGIASSRKAFMALKFGDRDLDHLVERHLRPAVMQAGFTLFQLDDEPKAGSIDDRLRVRFRPRGS